MRLKLWPSLNTGDTSSYILKEEYFFFLPSSVSTSATVPDAASQPQSSYLRSPDPQHCHTPPSLVSEFPLLTWCCFLVPPSVCCFPLVKFCLLSSCSKEFLVYTASVLAGIFQPIPDFYFEQPKLEKSTFFDSAWSIFSPG